jgi:hypothetical protein
MSGKAGGVRTRFGLSGWHCCTPYGRPASSLRPLPRHAVYRMLLASSCAGHLTRTYLHVQPHGLESSGACFPAPPPHTHTHGLLHVPAILCLLVAGTNVPARSPGCVQSGGACYSSAFPDNAHTVSNACAPPLVAGTRSTLWQHIYLHIAPGVSSQVVLV